MCFIQPSELQLQGNAQETLYKRPLFVTTVPRGIFLQPQPVKEVIPVYPRHIFTYASRPRILINRQHYAESNISIKNSSLETQSQLSNRLPQLGELVGGVAGIKITKTR